MSNGTNAAPAAGELVERLRQLGERVDELRGRL